MLSKMNCCLCVQRTGSKNKNHVTLRINQRFNYLYKMNTQCIEDVIVALNGSPILNFLTTLLENKHFYGSSVCRQFLNDLPTLLDLLIKHPDMTKCIKDITFAHMMQTLETEIVTMATIISGWHFSARNASYEQIDKFSIHEMAETLTRQTPYLWNLLGVLLASDPVLERCQAHHMMTAMHPEVVKPSDTDECDITHLEWSNENKYWA